MRVLGKCQESDFGPNLHDQKKSLCRPSVPEMTKSNQNDEESLRGSLSLPIYPTSIPFRYMYPLLRG